MLVIDPDICIDCGVCVSECPIQAIVPDTDKSALKWLNLNRDYAKKWPNITRKGSPPPDAGIWAKEENKYPCHFSEKPGKSCKTEI